MPVMHQAVKAFLANQRQGTASTKTRGEVTGGNQKPWKQKGTGRARQGSTRAPNWPGGGTVFGPMPRNYTQIVPKQVQALARKSAFNARARENAVMVVDALDYSAPNTKSMLALLGKLGVAGKKVLFLTDGVKPNVYLSARNLRTRPVMPYQRRQHLSHAVVGRGDHRSVGADPDFGRGISNVDASRTIVRPIITERTSAAYQDRGEYTFEVHPKRPSTPSRRPSRVCSA